MAQVSANAMDQAAVVRAVQRILSGRPLGRVNGDIGGEHRPTLWIYHEGQDVGLSISTPPGNAYSLRAGEAFVSAVIPEGRTRAEHYVALAERAIEIHTELGRDMDEIERVQAQRESLGAGF